MNLSNLIGYVSAFDHTTGAVIFSDARYAMSFADMQAINEFRAMVHNAGGAEQLARCEVKS